MFFITMSNNLQKTIEKLKFLGILCLCTKNIDIMYYQRPIEKETATQNFTELPFCIKKHLCLQV